MATIKAGILVRMEAKPGKEAEVEKFLIDALSLVEAEAQTPVWFAIRLGATTFGIFDAFADDAARQQHVNGKVAAALMARADELFAAPPVFEMPDVLAHKLP